jgi:hypothetical protein
MDKGYIIFGSLDLSDKKNPNLISVEKVVSMDKIAILVFVSFGLLFKAPMVFSEGLSLKVDKPIILHDRIAGQWGGHTFCYLLLGEKNIFWSATAYDENDKTPTALIGQYPLGGSSPKVSTIRFTDKNVKGSNQPQMIRTSDGYIHVFIGVTYTTDNPSYNKGKLRYYRSKDPDDISTLIDRTELIPTEPYNDFHLRMNVGVSPDSKRMVLVILAISEDGSVPFNTPVIFFGERQGLDFVFQKPTKYENAMGFFYPQVAVTDDGIVIVGEIWDDKEIHTTRIIHIDWNGKLVHREDLPANGNGSYFSYDLRPINPKDWSKLIIYYNRYPEGRKVCHHEFWEYNTKTKQLKLLKSLEVEDSLANSGKWIPVSDKYSIFINNPSMGQYNIWEGDILGDGSVNRTPLPNTNPIELGYQATAYTFVPNVLQGSVVSDEIYLASDCFNSDKKPDKSGPCSFLLWRLDLKPE